MVSTDDLICAYLRAEPGSEDGLAGAGEDLLKRVTELWDRTATTRLPGGLPRFESSADVDRWTRLVGIVAQANPKGFMTWVESGLATGHIERVSGSAVVRILGCLDDDDALRLVSRFLHGASDITRYNAAAVLAQHTASLTARAGIELALRDSVPLVRLEAIKALATWDPAQGAQQLSSLLTVPDLPPMISSEAADLMAELATG